MVTLFNFSFLKTSVAMALFLKIENEKNILRTTTFKNKDFENAIVRFFYFKTFKGLQINDGIYCLRGLNSVFSHLFSSPVSVFKKVSYQLFIFIFKE